MGDIPERWQGFSNEEIAIAKYLEALGQQVAKNLQEGALGAGRQGDAFVNGVLTEFKTLDSGATENTIKNRVNKSIKGMGQAREIIIDARHSCLDENTARNGTFKALGIGRGKIDGITVIGDGFFFRYQPKLIDIYG